MNTLKNKKVLTIITIIILAIIIVFFFWPKNSASNERGETDILSTADSENLTTRGDSKVPWNEAISILRSGEVRQVSQLHSLEIIIVMNNNDQITTTEPAIDEVIEELKLCGKICEDIVISTE